MKLGKLSPPALWLDFSQITVLLTAPCFCRAQFSLLPLPNVCEAQAKNTAMRTRDEEENRNTNPAPRRLLPEPTALALCLGCWVWVQHLAGRGRAADEIVTDQSLFSEGDVVAGAAVTSLLGQPALLSPPYKLWFPSQPSLRDFAPQLSCFVIKTRGCRRSNPSVLRVRRVGCC